MKQRLSAWVDADLVQAAKAAVDRGRSVSVSAWVNDALRLKRDHERRLKALSALMTDHERQRGKITVEVPADLLEEARAATGEGVTATVREGLKILASRWAQREFMKLRRKVKLKVDLNQLRADR